MRCNQKKAIITSVFCLLTIISTSTTVLASFAATGSLSIGRYSPAAAILPNGKVLVAGGRSSGAGVKSAELYNPQTGTFAALPDMNSVRYTFTATKLNDGKILLAGGHIDGSNATSSAELFDPSTNTFTPTGSMTVPRTQHTATLLPNGKVLIAGGYHYTTYYKSAEMFDPSNGTFTAIPDMNKKRAVHTAELLNSGKVLLAGGYDQSIATTTDTAELYDPVLNTFALTGTMTAVRQLHTSSKLNDGCVLLTGGIKNNSGNPLATAELYDPASGIFSATGSLSASEVAHGAIRLTNGRVLTFGEKAEIYDHLTGSFSSAGTAVTGRSYPVMVALDNSNILITGGSETTTSAEIYNYDGAAPTITLNSTPLNYSNQASGAIAFTANETATFECKVDGGTFTACTSPFSYSSVANGQHTVTIKATDGAGNISSSTFTWTVNSALTASAAILLPQTGQTKCYDTAGVELTSCSGTRQDGDIRAGVPWPNPRFTDNGNETVTDNLTGFIWTKDANLISSRDPSFDNESGAAGLVGDGRVTWQTALNYIIKLNSENYAGHNDWRLPNVNELESLLDLGNPNMIISSSHPFTNIKDLYYWTSTSTVSNPAYAMEVRALDSTFDGIGKNIGLYVWAVRTSDVVPVITLPATGLTKCFDLNGTEITCQGTGQDGAYSKGAMIAQRFHDNLDGLVIDNITGLKWTKDANTPGPQACNPGVTKTFQQAQAYIECLNLGNYLGYADWRLPNRKELISLIDYGNKYPALQTNHPFVGVQSVNRYYMTANPVTGGKVWKVGLGYGRSFLALSNEAIDVWPIRGGYIQQKLTVTKSGTGTGTVTPSSGTLTWTSNIGTTRINPGNTIILTATPDTGNTFTSWSGCDSVSSNLCTITMNTAKSPTATFTSNIQTFPITVTVPGGNGTVSCTSPVNYNASSTCTINPAAGYQLATFTDNGADVKSSVSGNSYTIANVTATHSITATFILSPINGSCGNSNGGTFTAAPTTELCSTGMASAVSGNGPWSWDCSSINGGGTASCTAYIKTWTITASATAGGSITPAGSVTVNHNSTQQFTLAANSGFTFTGITGSCPAGTVINATYTTGSITANCSVIANYADTATPVIVSGPTVSSITNTSAVVEWATNKLSTGSVVYGLSSIPDRSVTDSTLANTHRVTLSGLTPETLYYLRTTATDALHNGTTSTPVISFRTVATPDTTPPVIVEGPMATNISDNGVTIVWKSDEPATSSVFWVSGATNGTQTDTTLTTTHSVRITGLTAATRYSFTVSSKDAFNNGPTLSAAVTFTTASTPDTKAPVIILQPIIKNVNHQMALIYWETDEQADSVIEYGTTSALGMTDTQSALGTKHNRPLTGLIAGTKYYFRVLATDSFGNGPTASPVYSFTTDSIHNTKTPVITKPPEIIYSTDLTGIVYFETDVPCDTVVEYGEGNSFTSRQSNGDKVNKHQITITNLKPDTSYKIQVSCTDMDGNTVVAKAGAPSALSLFNADSIANSDVVDDKSITGFMTRSLPDTTAPVITEAPAVIGLTESTAIIAWKTDELSDSTVSYAPRNQTTQLVTGSMEQNTEHTITLTNLEPNTLYSFQASSKDPSGNGPTTSAPVTFTTKQTPDTTAPGISKVQAVPTNSTAVITWTTDKAATTKVLYGKDATMLTNQVTVEGMSISHTATLTNLQPGTTYYVSVVSTDISLNEATSNVSSFMTSGNASPITWRHQGDGSVYGMTTNGGTATGGMFYQETNQAWQIVGQGDFDGDGIRDLVWWNSSTGQVYIMLMSSPTALKSGAIAYTEPNTNWKIVATGDINGDGTTDLIWWNQQTGQVYAMLINGTAITGGNIIYTEPDTNWKIVAAADFNGNGKAELLWWNSTTGQVAIGQTNGTSASSANLIWYEPDTSWRIAGAGDLDGDGKADIIWHNRTTGQVYGMQTNGSSVTNGAMMYSEPNTNWEIVSVANYNSDNKAELLWWNQQTGQVYLMPMNGLSVAGGSLLYTEPDTTWRIQGETEWRDNLYGRGVTTTTK